MKPGILEEDEEEQFDEGDFNEVELIAHDCRELLLQDIDAEKRAIAGAHSFENKVMSMDNMMMHLFLEADGQRLDNLAVYAGIDGRPNPGMVEISPAFLERQLQRLLEGYPGWEKVDQLSPQALSSI